MPATDYYSVGPYLSNNCLWCTDVGLLAGVHVQQSLLCYVCLFASYPFVLISYTSVATIAMVNKSCY